MLALPANRSRRACVGELAQVAHLVCPGGTGNGGRSGAISLSGKAISRAEPGGGVDGARPAGEPRGHLRPGAQVLAGPGRQPAVQLVQAAAGPHRRHRGGQRPARRAVVVRGGGGDDRQPLLVGERGERLVPLVGERVELVGQLDGDVVAAEPVDQLGQRPPRRARAKVPAPAFERLPHRALAAAGEDQPVPVGRLGELVDVVDRPALRAAAQLRLPDRPRQRGVAGRVAGEHQQVGAGRVGVPDPRGDRTLGLGGGHRHVQVQFGAEHGGQAQRVGRLGEPDDAVHAVVVGEGECVEPEATASSASSSGRRSAVEEAERRVRVQLGVGHCRGRRAGRIRGS